MTIEFNSFIHDLSNLQEIVSTIIAELNKVGPINRHSLAQFIQKYPDAVPIIWSRKSGAQSVGRGRTVENEVEKLVQSLGLKYIMRTRFKGRGGETAPCDLAIPSDGDKAMIVIGMKGFNSRPFFRFQPRIC